MNKYILTRILNGLEKNTKNFTYVKNREVESSNDYHPDIYLANDIDRIYSCIQRQEENVKNEYIKKGQLPIAIGFNIFENHYLANGNKRLAGVLYKIYGNVDLFYDVRPTIKEEQVLTKSTSGELFIPSVMNEINIIETLNRGKDELTYLEDR